jgi:hypothetical protein
MSCTVENACTTRSYFSNGLTFLLDPYIMTSTVLLAFEPSNPIITINITGKEPTGLLSKKKTLVENGSVAVSSNYDNGVIFTNSGSHLILNSP